jgi:hypothetical protein
MIKTWTPTRGPRDGSEILLWGMVMQSIPRQASVSVIDTATKLPTTPLSGRRFLFICNNSDEIIYLGDSAVTTADGFPLYQHQSILINIEDGVDLYGVSTNAGGSNVRILEGA